jgi:hypothetical protein
MRLREIGSAETAKQQAADLSVRNQDTNKTAEMAKSRPTDQVHVDQ